MVLRYIHIILKYLYSTFHIVYRIYYENIENCGIMAEFVTKNTKHVYIYINISYYTHILDIVAL